MTMSKHLGRGATALVAIVLVAGACSSGSASSAPASAGAPSAGASSGAVPADAPTLMFIAQIDNPSQAFSWKMYQKNAAQYGFNVSVCDNKGDVQQQTTCINDAVAQGVEAIAINPVDEAGYVPATKAAMAAGIPVCLSMVPPAEEAIDGSTCSVSVDDILGGETAAAAIHERTSRTAPPASRSAARRATSPRTTATKASPRPSKARTSGPGLPEPERLGHRRGPGHRPGHDHQVR